MSADLSGFEPTSFDGQCAVCHLKDGVLPVMTDPVVEALVSPPLAGADAVRRPGRGRLVVSGLAHRDPWVLQNVRLLARGIYGDEEGRERAALEARLAALEAARRGSLADAATADLARQRDALQRQPGATASPLHERVRLELERRESRAPAPVSLAATLSEDRALESATTAVRARLAVLRERMSVAPVAAGERARRLDAIQSLVSPCLTCHTLQKGVEIAPVQVDARRLERARFTHAPHVIQVACDACHTAVATSTRSTDLNTPGLDTCRKCHATGQAPFDCTVCHRYHPSPDAGFTRAAPGK